MVSPPAAPAKSASLVPPARRHAGSERFDEAIVVTRTRAWIGLAACLVLVAGMLVWSVTAEVGVTVGGTGVALQNGAIATVRSPATGTVQTLAVNVGQQVTAGQPVGSVADAQQNIYPLIAPVAGQVLAVNESVGSPIESGGHVVSLAQTSGPMLIKVFLTPSQAQQIDVGMRAILAFSGGPTVDGNVVTIGALPLTVDEAADSIGNAALALLLVKGDTVVPVTIAPEPGDDAASIESGDVATVTLIIGSNHPISYIF
jgi:biotin carboxyl carrier protein